MDKFVERDFPRLLELLYDAALDARLWPAFLDRLAASFGDACGIVRIMDNGCAPTFHTYGSDPEYQKSYADYYRTVNPYSEEALSEMPLGRVAFASQLVEAESVEQSEFFNDWMKPQGISPHHFGVAFRKDEAGSAILSVAPHESVFAKDRKRFAKQLTLLTPHLIRAAQIAQLAAAQAWNADVLRSSLNEFDTAALLVSASGTVLLANAEAEGLLRRERLLAVDRAGQLRAQRPADDATFQAALVAATQISDASARGPLRLKSASTGSAFLAWLVPHRSSSAANASLGSPFLSADFRLPCAFLFVRPVLSGAFIPVEAIQAAFGLSAAEARLLGALASGLSLSDYAKNTGSSRNTVRNQLATIFDKTGTSRQAELVALTLRTLGPFSSKR